MPRLPLEDDFHHVITKARRGLGLSEEELAARAEISPEELARLLSGQWSPVTGRRVARHLRLSPYALERLAMKDAPPPVPLIPRGFALFTTGYRDFTVNNYLVWDARTRDAAVIDTGTSTDELLLLARSEELRVRYILLTHTHRDHVAALPDLVAATGAQVWSSVLEPIDFPGARTFAENAYFHLGVIAIKTLATGGHSPGQTSFYVQGLARPLALCGDALFSASLGGSETAFETQVKSTRARIFSLPKDTVIGPGHGPLTTLAHERIYNPFFAPDTPPADLNTEPPAPRPSPRSLNRFRPRKSK
jgi:glyoxylase-like metal-dependent hydrolase (beta-lactamase superfamily II)